MASGKKQEEALRFRAAALAQQGGEQFGPEVVEPLGQRVDPGEALMGRKFVQ